MSDQASIKTIGTIILICCLASSISTKSLNKAVLEVLNCIDINNQKQDLSNAKKKLSKIVGRDVKELNQTEILRATAETASENSVDGIFAPLFWMSIGIFLWKISFMLPGPLTMAWAFKATSTIDSMIGYKQGRLKWLGYAGAKLDDLLTWIPSRLVLLTLPLTSRSWNLFFKLTQAALIEGALDESPNSGISEAIFAHCASVRMGGKNTYNGVVNIKPTLAKDAPEANPASIKKILDLSLRLEFCWLTILLVVNHL